MTPVIGSLRQLAWGRNFCSIFFKNEKLLSVNIFSFIAVQKLVLLLFNSQLKLRGKK